MTDYAAVLTVLYPGAEWTLDGDDYSGLTWYSDSEMPSQADLDAAWPAVEMERKWKALRSERDRLLAACDWTQVADAPLTASDKQAWADYRQALRDVPQDFDSPDDVVWPEAP
jgi:hypothetical protein